MQVKHHLASGWLVELLDGHAIGIKGLHHRPRHMLRRRHHG